LDPLSTSLSTPASTPASSARVGIVLEHLPKLQNLQRIRMSPEHSTLLLQILPHENRVGAGEGASHDLHPQSDAATTRTISCQRMYPPVVA
jgi:hypothetical protein